MEMTVIEPVDPALIEAELTAERFLRTSNKGNNKIYVVTAADSPNTMREIGRLREIAFRSSGGGTGKDCDIDEFDTMAVPCRQLIVWDPATRQILGGYRYLLGADMEFDSNGVPHIATSHMFNFSEEFLRDYLPYTIELGRSFVRLEYQNTREGAKALYALDNLWDGLGCLTVIHPEIKYLFGKVTMYPDYIATCRDMILFFLHKYFPDPDGLVRPKQPLEITSDPEALEALFCGGDFRSDYRILNAEVHARGLNIPPLVNAYMGLSPTMRMFGTAINHEFGEVEESGIFLTISEIFPQKKERHINSYHP